ncbi:uncharacterized protein FA14DRAFT_161549 [Meira miltonrushii]|uniref:TRP C-terminal domain-containing protein n=1 Tax=Meira miltonrushii TaxID=1280837 RepID=A0A316VEM8_9BASI|nr:uncharacterized protein FA14DRAFT_161549 [Meira miltonrushii]PWN33935.1 hypothetical protein FA14DRAFT_161549 [Meira miltonrushii]
MRHTDRSYLRLIAFCILTLSIWTASSTAQSQTNASLNRPDATAAATASNGDRVVTSTLTVGGATQTTIVSGAGAAVAEPTSTDVSSISFSSQRVPYLLNLPEKEPASLQDSFPQWSGPTFTGCDDDESIDYAASPFRINVSAVYTQIDTNLQDGGRMNTFGSATYGNLRIVALGDVGNETHAFSNGLLSAAGVSTRFLTFSIFNNYTFLCDRVYPANNDTLNPNVIPASCQFGPGPVAFGVDVPLNSSYEAGTLWTQIRLLDHSNPARTLACIEVQTSPYNPDSWYWKLVLWLPVALFCAFFCLATIAAITTAETAQRMAYKNRAREGGPPTFVRDKLRPMILSALAGREMIRSPALLRFVTPGCWDILLYLQFLVALIMCHVQWPDFVYPFARQLAWSTLLGNVTIVEKERQSHDILATNTFLPEGDVGAQMQNASSPLFMNSQQENKLLNLGTSSTGMERYASAVGLQASSFFGTCLTIWLALVAVVIAVSLLAWIIDAFFEMRHRRTRRQEEASGEILQTSPRQSLSELKANPRHHHSDMSTHPLFGENEAPSGRLGRAKMGHHMVAMHGNLIRALVLFHLPITIVSTYQFANPAGHSTVSIALSALSFAIFSVLTPFYLIRRIARTSTEKLYEDNNTLLALGPVYHTYAPGSQLFYSVSFVHSLALGIVVGVAQKSGSAQAIVIMVVEVIAALASSLWLPWGEGAMMGPLNFMTGVLRIVSAVLVLLLTSLVGFSNQARGWLTYVLLLIQAIFLAGAILVLLIKLVEAFVRAVWRVRFDERLSGRTAGLGGAIRKIRRRKLKNRKAALPLQLRKAGQKGGPQHQVRPSVHSRNTSMGSSSTMAMLDKAGPISMSDNRYSYVEYLDHGQRKRPRSVGSDLDYFGKMSPSGSGRMTPYSPIQARPYEQDDTGSIMAAMPPLSAGDQRNNPAFVRVRGDRASDGNPYTPKTAPPTQAMPGRLPRPQSASGINGEWANNQMRRQSNRPFPSPGHPSAQRPNRVSTHEMSSTQAAAFSARHSLAGLPQVEDGSNNKSAKKGPFAGWRRKMNPNRRGGIDSDDSDDDWSEEEGGTWNSRAAAQNRAPWMGAVKISAAIQSLFGGAHAGTATATLEGRAPVRTEEIDPPQKGFEVVRKARPAQRTPVAERLSDAASQKADAQNEQEQSLLPKPEPMEREASDFYRDTQVTPPPLGQRMSNMSPSDFYESHLGILGADMQRATSSAGHSINEPGEERFWLPPIDVSTDDGSKNEPVVHDGKDTTQH